ncbi:bacterial alpha-L-rhamnosidase-domain-containing protein [Aspergillus venezuelensis]
MAKDQPTLTTPSFEQHPTGFGIGVAAPRISWRFLSTLSTVQNWEQSAYDIEVVHLPGSEVERYHFQSPSSILVPWPSRPLLSRGQARTRVRAYGKAGDNDQGTTDWSPWAQVECGLLNRSDWISRPITTVEERALDGPQRPLRFRKTFAVPFSELGKARLYITSLGSYVAFINGRRISDECFAPGWTSYNHRINYRVFEIAEFLRPGQENTIGVEVGEGWYATSLGFFGGTRCIWGKELAVLAQLEIISDSGEEVKVFSDESWKCKSSAIIRSEIYDGELYDARMEDGNGDWHGANMVEDDSWLKTRALELPCTQLVIPDAPPVRVTETVKPTDIFTTPSGRTIIDFGQNLVGKLCIHCLDKPFGTKVTFVHAEVMEDGELGIRPLRAAKCTDEIITSDSTLLEWCPQYTFHGFRYVQVDGWTATDEICPLTFSSISALVMHTDMIRTGHFSCSHPLVNKLHENAVWSMRGNFLSIPTDCPQRDERLGWTGDIQIFGPSANFLYNTAGMLGDWLRDVSSEQLSHDHSIPPLVIPNAIPQLWDGNPQAVWDDVTVLAPWALFQTFGDLDILRRQYQSMVAWVDKGIPRGADGLWDIDYWQLGDWLDPTAPPDQPGNARTNPTLVADAYLIRVTQVIAQVSELLQESSNATRYRADYLRLKSTFQQKYVAPSGLIIGDTQTALSLALTFSLLDREDQIVNAGNRLAYLVRLAGFRVSTGFVGTPIVTHALTRAGHAQLAFRMLLEKGCPSWLYPITMGATTIWERWDSMKPDGSINGGEMTSFNHYALGSIVNWLHTTVAGISPLEPGWRCIKIQPIPGGTITSANASYESPYGRVECSWAVQSGDTFCLDILVPPNCRALVVLPGDDEEEGGQWMGSGRYSFTRAYTPAPWPPSPVRDFLGEPSVDLIA